MSGYLRPNEDVVAAYARVRTRVIDIMRSRPEADGYLPVPHCPGWSVRDLLAHLVGGPEDVLAGRLDGVATEAWTNAQVERHRGEAVAALIAAWEATATEFDAVLEVIPPPINSQVVVDAVTHEHDLRHALGAPGARDGLAVAVAKGWILDVAHEHSPEHAELLLDLDLGDFDLIRVCAGRRSREQIRSLGVDVDLIEALMDSTPVSLPALAIDE